MAQEEHNQKGSNSSGGGGGGRSSKKLKQQKVPQRGLGVAQLEKIRIEEQQKKDAAAILSPNSIISQSNPSYLAAQCAPFRHNPSPSSIPLPPPPPPPPTDFSSPNSIFRPAPSIPIVDVLHPNSVPLSKPLNMGSGEIGWPAVSGSGHGNWPKLWNYEYNLEMENHRLDHNGFAFPSTMNLPYESWTPHNVMHRTLQFQQPSSSPSSSMLNVSSGTSSSSAINFQMELPSNQSYYGNNYTHMWPEEEKMAGMKRSYPFSLDNPPGPSVYCKFPPAYVAPITRSDESASCSNRGTATIEPGNPVFREGPSSSTSMSQSNSKKVIKEYGSLNGDFLTLAPPATILPHPSSKHKHPPAYIVPRSRELSEFGSLPYQGRMEDPIQWQRPNGSIQQQPFYSFFPSAKAQTGQAATSRSNCSDEEGESVDLNLKL
ncbi:hypothetical protein F0562_008989 [Nyssa sinensis]|uniref:Uncharacterized protein n=1 Tax=Nyssa sinensis TaxID=561372 RepID=A0A5J5AA50_9ASTE|nr:hypothetical protein F0562_008989 [Nyssa sinensis]